MILNPDAVSRANVAERDYESLRDGFNAGQSSYALVHFTIDLPSLGFLIADLGEVHGKVQNMLGIEPEIDLLRLLQAADKKPGHDQKYKRTRHLRYDQRISCQLAPRSRS